MLPYLDSQLHMTMLPGFSFHVVLAGIPMAFQKVSSLEESIETEPLYEGGVNGYVRSLRSPVNSEKKLILEKGIPVGNLPTELANEALSSQLLRVGNRLPFALIIVCNRKINRISRAYMVVGLMLKTWSLSDLNAMSSDYLVERMEFTYEYIDRHKIQTAALGASVLGSAAGG